MNNFLGNVSSKGTFFAVRDSPPPPRCAIWGKQDGTDGLTANIHILACKKTAAKKS
jgi:hypothetical protein